MNQSEKYMLKHYMGGSLNLRGLLLVVLAGSWLAGILLGSWLALPQAGSLGVATLGLGAACAGWRKPRVRIAGLALLCLCLGAWRYATVSPRGDAHAISAFIGVGKVEIQAEIIDEPRLETNSTLLTVAVQSVSLDKGQTWRMADGEMQAQALGATFDNPYAPRYGDTIQLAGSLTVPPS